MEETTATSNNTGNGGHATESFMGHDAKSSYLYFLNLMPVDTIQEYYKLKQLIKHGKTLLRCIKTVNDIEKKKIIDRLFMDAGVVLKEETIKKRNVKYDQINLGGQRITLYKMYATDANECHAETEKLGEMQRDFEKQQYSQHISKLEEVQERIHTQLVVNDVIPAIDDSVDYLIDKMIKDSFNKMFEKQQKNNNVSGG